MKYSFLNILIYIIIQLLLPFKTEKNEVKRVWYPNVIKRLEANLEPALVVCFSIHILNCFVQNKTSFLPKQKTVISKSDFLQYFCPAFYNPMDNSLILKITYSPL